MSQPWQTPEAIAAALREPRVYGKSYKCAYTGCKRREPMSWAEIQRHVKRAHKGKEK